MDGAIDVTREDDGGPYRVPAGQEGIGSAVQASLAMTNAREACALYSHHAMQISRYDSIWTPVKGTVARPDGPKHKRTLEPNNDVALQPLGRCTREAQLASGEMLPPSGKLSARSPRCPGGGRPLVDTGRFVDRMLLAIATVALVVATTEVAHGIAVAMGMAGSPLRSYPNQPNQQVPRHARHNGCRQ